MRSPAAAAERLASYLCDGVPTLEGDTTPAELSGWLGSSRRFQAFAEVHRDKIRKKLRVSAEPGARGDVRAELQAAYLLLNDRRIELAFEAYGSGQRGPDFTVTFRASHRFNLEVTRPRKGNGDGDAASIIAGALLAKLRQLPVDAPNAILVAGALADSDRDVELAVRELKRRADQGDERFFTAKGTSMKEFQALHRRMAFLMVGQSSGGGIHSWTNPESRRALPEGSAIACVRAMAAAKWTNDASSRP